MLDNSYQYEVENTMKTDDNASLFLAFRRFFPIVQKQKHKVYTQEDIRSYIEKRLTNLPKSSGILLSGGIDSAILANYMPEGTIAYTFDYSDAPEKMSEFDQAKKYIKKGVIHKRLIITRKDYFKAADELINLKKMPVVPHDPVIYIACKAAKSDGHTHLITGIGTGGFGSNPQFYQHNSYDDFVEFIFKKYLDPKLVLNNPSDVNWVFNEYREGNTIDVQRFLNEVGTEGNAVQTTIESSGLKPVMPFAEMEFVPVLDREKIISGKPKYLLADIYSSEYPNITRRKKAPLHVPYGLWFLGYRPHHYKIRKRINMSKFKGKRKALIYSLERYLMLLDGNLTINHGRDPFKIKNRMLRPIYYAAKTAQNMMNTIKGIK